VCVCVCVGLFVFFLSLSLSFSQWFSFPCFSLISLVLSLFGSFFALIATTNEVPATSSIASFRIVRYECWFVSSPLISLVCCLVSPSSLSSLSSLLSPLSPLSSLSSCLSHLSHLSGLSHLSHLSHLLFSVGLFFLILVCRCTPPEGGPIVACTLDHSDNPQRCLLRESHPCRERR
jgi:hypothetical protein